MPTPITGAFRLHAIAMGGTVEGLPPPWPSDILVVIDMSRALCARVGYRPPWIRYLATEDGDIIGGGAFVGPPNDGALEIAYFTLPELANRKGAHRFGDPDRRGDRHYGENASTENRLDAYSRMSRFRTGRDHAGPRDRRGMALGSETRAQSGK